MEKKNGFIAISILYSFFLCFVMLMAGLLANYVSTKFLLDKLNVPLNIKIGTEDEEKIEAPDFVDNKTVVEEKITLSDYLTRGGGLSESYDIDFGDYRNSACPEKIDFADGEPRKVKPSYTCKPWLGVGNCCSSFAIHTGGMFKRSENGKDFYYFRGDVNNYIKFANMMWNIIRVNEDKSIRIVLNPDLNSTYNKNKIGQSAFNTQDNDAKYAGFTYDNKQSCTKNNPCKVDFNSSSTSASNAFNNTYECTNSTVKKYLEKWYFDNLKGYDSEIEYGIFCNDVSISKNKNGNVNSSTYNRIFVDRSPQISCEDPKDENGNLKSYGGVYRTKIGLITADEANMGGLSADTLDVGTNTRIATDDTYLYTYGKYRLTMSGSDFWGNKARIFDTHPLNVGMGNINVSDSYEYIYPVINLKADTLYNGGVGSENDPYTIK